ncbi:glutathione S-transferase C-terminal-like protein [Epithele typhae]|uniref:glutathione S-transferase C-terminal-like protein n=1 Tax=Epithele typhae TaxID=378194 RepID=UPI002007E3FC|nr:glutathione S-transferase C-terminal-like protein [Epithele typhae]KAH9913902.1 glutathione S-transferase C-terminal-like protein [Epithele typhae]
MVLKLYGKPTSTCTNRVQTVLEELSVPYEFVAIDLTKGEHKAPDFTAVQPFGQVPYIDDDGFVLFESRAICRYLALKYGGVEKGLIPAAASIELTNFDVFKAWVHLSALRIRARMFALRPTDPEAVAKLTAMLDSKLVAYDVLLGRTKYLAGDEIMLPDLFHLPYGAMLKKRGIDLLESGKYPNVTRWWADVSSRPSWKKVKGL